VARLQDADPPAGPGEQQRHGQAGQSRADDHVVEAVVGRERVLDPGTWAVEPQRRHGSSSSIHRFGT
jgi:hypothetical protein